MGIQLHCNQYELKLNSEYAQVSAAFVFVRDRAHDENGILALLTIVLCPSFGPTADEGRATRVRTANTLDGRRDCPHSQ